jgi:hypothetical protein
MGEHPLESEPAAEYQVWMVRSGMNEYDPIHGKNAPVKTQSQMGGGSQPPPPPE